jgi:hypothetical protein
MAGQQWRYGGSSTEELYLLAAGALAIVAEIPAINCHRG